MYVKILRFHPPLNQGGDSRWHHGHTKKSGNSEAWRIAILQTSLKYKMILMRVELLKQKSIGTVRKSLEFRHSNCLNKACIVIKRAIV